MSEVQMPQLVVPHPLGGVEKVKSGRKKKEETSRYL